MGTSRGSSSIKAIMISIMNQIERIFYQGVENEREEENKDGNEAEGFLTMRLVSQLIASVRIIRKLLMMRTSRS